ncbi:cyclin-dependent kinase 2 isoform X2 [Sitodiplosis mosellana]|uniref:cyclin-dependent kinase 2 isoform X2 n=1 Tax=Sitodiplosis mosellana TaxID=263140 RepID=UPI002444817A|nr:cyclin-dependent kinase 2 isoform X2 [Sitodiplosis mosellana]
MCSLNHFRRIEKIGTYGVVFKAVNTDSGKMVALKRIRLENESEGVPSTAIREVSLLKDLKHPSVIELYDVVIADSSLYMVFELLSMDLKKLLDKAKEVFTPQLIKSYMFQIFDAISFCHLNRILHRDLKPQNLLVDEYGHIKLADFGLARTFNIPMRAYTHEVVTLWYRAPEILLGTKLYATSVDLWSLGCIFAEMILRKPLFAGDSEIDQLYKIFQMMGTPNEQIWPGVSQMPDFGLKFPSWKPQQLPSLIVKYKDKDFLDLFRHIMVLDPGRRISAKNATQHSFFRNIEPVTYVSLPLDG